MSIIEQKPIEPLAKVGLGLDGKFEIVDGCNRVETKPKAFTSVTIALAQDNMRVIFSTKMRSLEKW